MYANSSVWYLVKEKEESFEKDKCLFPKTMGSHPKEILMRLTMKD